MKDLNQEFLNIYGWDTSYTLIGAEIREGSWIPARVVTEERHLYQVQFSLTQTITAAISGKLQFAGAKRVDFPSVGDWVMIEIPQGLSRAVIHQICPRKSTIYRKQAGEGVDLQILSTNVDYIFITTSVNDDLNPRRLERYLAMAWESGSTPILLLTKADQARETISKILEDIKISFPDVAVHAVSRNEFEKAEFLKAYLHRGKTSVFIGSSGVGKSTLVNFLIGGLDIKTQEIRETDGKGRHTTTSRHMYVSRFGGLVIDTPGMRELQLSDHGEGLQTHFSDIEELFTKCRFSDCHHQSEPGCAIKEALATGVLTKERWDSFQKLQSEIHEGLIKKDKALVTEEKKKWKKINSEAWEKGRSKKKLF